MNRAIWTVAGLLILAAGCAHSGGGAGFDVEDQARERVTRSYVGREYVLASSMYVSEFFGQSGRALAEARPSEIIEFWRHDGQKSIVTPQDGSVLPAGTPVRVSRLILPVDPVKAPFEKHAGNELAPTAHTWVVVERTDTDDKRELVLVLPKNIHGEEGFRDAMQERLASHAWVTAWLTQREPEKLDRIYRKDVGEGMAYAEVVAALGRPRNHRDQGKPGNLNFVADYGDLQVTFQGKLVSSVLSRKVAAAEAQRVAGEKAEQARVAAEERRQAEAEAARVAEQQRQQEADKQQAELAAKQAREEAAAHNQAAIEARRQQESQRREEARSRAEQQRREREQREQARIAAIEARKEGARLAKQAAEQERLQRVEAARAAKAAAEAEAAAVRAERQAVRDAARAEAEAAVARKRALAEERKRMAAEERQRKKADEAARRETEARLRAERDAQARAARDAEAAERARVASLARARPERRHPAAAAAATAPVYIPANAPAPSASGKGTIGIKVKTLMPKQVRSLEVPNGKGAYVAVVKWGSAAATAGMKREDVILAVDGLQVGSAREFALIASQLQPYQTVPIAIWRDEERMVLAVTPVDAELEKARKEQAKRIEAEERRRAKADKAARMQAEAQALIAQKRAEKAQREEQRRIDAEAARVRAEEARLAQAAAARARKAEAEVARKRADQERARLAAEERARKAEAEAADAKSRLEKQDAQRRAAAARKAAAAPVARGPRGKIGCSVRNLDGDEARRLHAPTTIGAWVTKVKPGSAAAEAGLQADDIVLNYNGVNIRDGRAFAVQAATAVVGHPVTLTIWRAGKRKAFAVVPKAPGAAKAATAAAAPAEEPRRPAGRRPVRPRGTVADIGDVES